MDSDQHFNSENYIFRQSRGGNYTSLDGEEMGLGGIHHHAKDPLRKMQVYLTGAGAPFLPLTREVDLPQAKTDGEKTTPQSACSADSSPDKGSLWALPCQHIYLLNWNLVNC